MQAQSTAVHDEPRIAPGMRREVFNRELYTAKQFVTVVLLIDKKLAEEFLERAGPLGVRSTAAVNQFAAVMAGQGWLLTHQGIGFNWDGKLVDGVTRLEAIVKSGISQEIQVTFGLNPKVYLAIDTGKGRQAKHLLQLAKVPKHMAVVLGQAIKLFQRYEIAVEEKKLPKPSRLTSLDIVNFHETHPDFLRIAQEVMGLEQVWRKGMPPSVVISLAYMAFRKGHPETLTMGFVKLIGKPTGDDVRHPVYVLWETLRDIAAKDGPMRNPEDKLIRSVHAYNKWVRKGKMSFVKGLSKPSAAEDAEGTEPDELAQFPTILRYVAAHHRSVNEIG